MRRLSVPNSPLPLRRTPEQALRSVTSTTKKGVFASSDRLFKDAIFGRDSLEVAEDLMLQKPQLVKNILRTIASLQGVKSNPISEEEPGKTIHEYRTTVVDGRPISEESHQILNRLSRTWGGTEDELAYYGSIDSTPLFIRTLADYCDTYGDEILNETLISRSGAEVSVLDVLQGACRWLTGKLQTSQTGLLEYRRTNPHGIENQVWKDSKEFYVFEDHSRVSHEYPVAAIEVQALAYDALVLVTALLPSLSLDGMAERLRNRTIQKLWLPDREYFATALAYDAEGRERTVNTAAANPAELLNSEFFDSLPEKERQDYVSAIVRRILSEDFLTDAGIRSRALSEAHLVNFWDYHGSFTSWPKETFDIAKGLRWHGFPRLADELDNRLLNAVKASGSYPEFFYVDTFGRVLGTIKSASIHGEIMLIDGRNAPERVQAWTVSAILAIKYLRKQPPRFESQPWQRSLEREILRKMPHVKEFKTKRELSARYPAYPYQIDRSG